MILKEVSDRRGDIETLQALKSDPRVGAPKIKQIEEEIRKLQAGVKGEKEAAYELDFMFKANPNWMVIHDLRLVENGRVAQIDHLVINRLLDIWICETKHFSDGVGINERGEFTAFYRGRPVGIPSPIEQNKKHKKVLESVFADGKVALPSRLGITIRPKLVGVVLVSKNARISRPKKAGVGDEVIKMDQFDEMIDRRFDDMNPMMVAKMVGPETIENLARQLLRLHRPIKIDWAAKFGVSASLPALSAQVDTPKVAAAPANTSVKDVVALEASKYVCAKCGVPVETKVARFCWFNKARFREGIYCRDHQKEFTAGG